MRIRLKIMALATVLSGAVVYVRSGMGQPGPLEFIPLAMGYSSDHQVKLETKGPSDVLQARLVAQPLGDTGWHTHPGPAVVVVTKGAVTEYHNGCVKLYPAGSAFFEQEGEVHRVVNHDPSVAAEAYLTFILPSGSPPLIPADEPRSTPCNAGVGR